MNDAILYATLIAEILAAFSVLVSIVWPHRRVWPPVGQHSMGRYLMWVLFTVAGIGAVAVGVVDRSSVALQPWVRYGLGAPLWSGGNGLGLWAMTMLGMGATLGGEDELVRRGPYRFSRNPQYVGFMAGLIGWGLLTSSIQALMAAAVGLIPLILVPFAEEPWLTARYGAAYEEYRRTTPRFLSLRGVMKQSGRSTGPRG